MFFSVKYDVFFNSQPECDAAYKLAAALANYDKDDFRTLKFLDVKSRDGKFKDKSQSELNLLKLPRIK